MVFTFFIDCLSLKSIWARAVYLCDFFCIWHAFFNFFFELIFLLLVIKNFRLVKSIHPLDYRLYNWFNYFFSRFNYFIRDERFQKLDRTCKNSWLIFKITYFFDILFQSFMAEFKIVSCFFYFLHLGRYFISFLL